jgi:hypothetical protein
MLSRCIAVVSIALFLVSEAGIYTINGYMQNSGDIPQWMSLVNAWLPVVRNLGALCAVTSLPRLWRQGLKTALIAIPLYGFFAYWSFVNFHQWTEVTNTNATRAKETSLEDILLMRPDIALKKDSYETAKLDKQRKEQNAVSLCIQNDGTKCIKARQEATKADTRYQQKQQEYETAMAEAKSTAIKETSAMSDKGLNWMNEVLPLTAGLLLSLL